MMQEMEGFLIFVFVVFDNVLKSKSNVVWHGVYTCHHSGQNLLCCGVTWLCVVSPQHFDHCADAYCYR